jgi:uncharacterized protein
MHRLRSDATADLSASTTRPTKMKRTFFLFTALSLLLLQSACEGGSSHYSIGTGNTGGIYYPIGGALASRLSALDADRQYTAEVTAASVENVKRLERDQIEVGMAISITVFQAFNGSEDFDRPFDALRIVAPLWPNPLNVIVTRASGINSIAEMRGRRVAVGSAGSGTEQVARALLAAHGITYADIQPFYLGFTEAASALRDGSIAAAFLEVAYPAAAVLEATTTANVRLLPVEGPEVEAMLREWPVFYQTTIPAGAYPGVTEAVPTIAELNWVVAREGLEDEVVHHILNILHHERDWLVQVNDVVNQIDLQELRRAPIPLHPAVQSWMEENLPAQSAGR